MELTEITAGNFLIRPWRTEDAPAVYRACQDPDIQRWTTVPSPYELAHATGFVTAISETGWANGTSAPFGVFDSRTGELLGSMGLVRLDLAGKEAELGYWTTPAARGHGVAVTAGRAVALWAIEKLGIERLIWRAEIGNHASRLVALRIGFRMEGIASNGAIGRAGDHIDMWIGSMVPGRALGTPPDAYGPGSPAALRAAAFGRAQPTIGLPGGYRLRPFYPTDEADAIATWRDPQTLAWASRRNSNDDQAIRLMLTDLGPAIWRRGDGALFAIAGSDDQFTGSASLVIPADDLSTAEVGYTVAPWARGHGLATKVLRILTYWAIDTLGVDRVEWRAHVGNEASRRVAEKAGYTFEGVRRAGCETPSGRRDAWVAAMLASDPR